MVATETKQKVRDLKDLKGQELSCLLTDFAPDHTPIVRVKGFGAPIFIKCHHTNERGRDFFFETIGYHFDKQNERVTRNVSEQQKRFRIKLTDVTKDSRQATLGYAYFIPDTRYNN